MFSLVITAASDRDQLIADLWEAGTTGITEEADSVRAFFEEDQEPEALARLARYSPVLQREDEHDWVRHFEEQWQPFAVGERWWLAPDWSKDDPPPGRIRLRIHPGMACGTGWHAATQLCLQAMERHVRSGVSVLDVGTGSGILADAARLLGADPVFGCDIEAEATMVARENLTGTNVGLFTGSLRSVRDRSVEVVVANLNAATIRQLAGELGRVSGVNGTLILSGFREEEIPGVVKACGAEPAETLEQDGWACLVFQRAGPPK